MSNEKKRETNWHRQVTFTGFLVELECLLRFSVRLFLREVKKMRGWRKGIAKKTHPDLTEHTTLSCWMVLSLLVRSHCSCFLVFSTSHSFCLKAFSSSLMVEIFRWEKSWDTCCFWMINTTTATKKCYMKIKISLRIGIVITCNQYLYYH